MAQAAKAEEEPPLPRGKKKRTARDLKSSIIPIAAGVAAATLPTPEPMVLGKVVSINRIVKKSRYDFKDPKEYEIHQVLYEMQQAEFKRTGELMQEIVGTVEVPNPDLLAPAAGSAPVVLDEGERLAAYLAHHNPVGATKHIPTVEGYIHLKDGTAIKVGYRQDFLDPGEPYVPYGGFESDGQCFKLTGDLKVDRRNAERLTRRSQNSRQSKGKVGKTAYENLIKIQDYRPVPDVMWFLRNPDGKSYLRGDLNPYPVGIVPTGADEAQYISDKKEHSHKVAEFMNEGMMQAYEVDDVPWSYADELPKVAANDSDQVSTTQGSDATEVTPVKGGVAWEIRLTPYEEVPPMEAVTEFTYPETGDVAISTSIVNEEEGIHYLNLDLRDPRAGPMLKVVRRELEGKLKDLRQHLWKVVQAQMFVQAYNKSGTFSLVEGADYVPEETGVRSVIDAIPYRAPKVRHELKGYAKMSQRADELRNATLGRLRVWNREYDQRKEGELNALKRHHRYVNVRISKELSTHRSMVRKLTQYAQIKRGQEALALHEHLYRMDLLEKELGRVKALIPEEVMALRSMGSKRQRQPHLVRATLWEMHEGLRKTIGKAKHALNLGPKKVRRPKVVKPPSVARTPPTKTEAVITPLPSKQPVPRAPTPEVQYNVIIPKMAVVTFENDPVLASIRRSFMARLAKSGRFSLEELEAADKQAFQTLVA